MRSATLMTVAASLLIAGCAGNPINAVECAVGTTTKNCAEGTLGHQQMAQEKEADDTTGAIDDAKCRSFAAPSSQHISTVDVEQRTIENHRNLVDGKRGKGRRGRADGGVAAWAATPSRKSLIVLA